MFHFLQLVGILITFTAQFAFALEEKTPMHAILENHFQANWISREDWQANPPRSDISRWTQDWNTFAIHHTAGGSASSAQNVRSIQHYHQNDRNWSDIAYHFLIGNDGKVFEGRSLNFQGADVKGHNSYTIGITAIGCFDDEACDGRQGPPKTQVTDALLNSFGELIGLLAYQQNITSLSHDNVKGHREFEGARTLCPGHILNFIGDMIHIAQRFIEKTKQSN